MLNYKVIVGKTLLGTYKYKELKHCAFVLEAVHTLKNQRRLAAAKKATKPIGLAMTVSNGMQVQVDLV